MTGATTRDPAAGPDDASDPAAYPDSGPERTCIVTRVKGPPDGFIRFVVGPDRQVTPDLRCKLPGRGAWVTAERPRVLEAVKRRSFKRAFKSEVEVPPTLADMIDGLMEKDALQALSLANKAGLVVAGATKVEGSIGPKVPVALISASDGSADGIRKMEAAVRRLMGDDADSIARIRDFRSDQLDLALGRTNVIHAAVAGGTAAEGFVARARRLARYRGTPKAETAVSEPTIETELIED
ncbi:RNA-binding protein [Lichenibacterium dinghuense]|uniref:RNA-binding protein n=1 Tax=Lichenibacterium dinghuense TaxID=2895977 RepID=UPI001F1C83E4|nr:RNA-binding protein [Lichenibacterium sp. 6Y81]